MQRPASYNLDENAILAIVRLTNGAAACEDPKWALGPRKGTDQLARDIAFGLNPKLWVEDAVRAVVAKSALGSLTSAKSAL